MNDLDEVARKREQQNNRDAVQTSAYERVKATGALDEQRKLDDQKRQDEQRQIDQRRDDDRRADDLRKDEDRDADFYKRYEAEKAKLADREDSHPTAKMLYAAGELAAKDNLKGPNPNSFNDTRAWLNAHRGIEDINQQRRAKSQANESSGGQDRDDKGSADRLTSKRSNSRDLEMESPAAQGPGDFVDIYGNPVSRAQLEGALANYQAQAARGRLPSSVQDLANGQGIGVKPEPRGWVPEIGNELPDTTETGTPDTTGAPVDNEVTNAADAVSDTVGIDKQGLSVASQAVDNLLDIGVDAAPQEDSQADIDVGKSDEEKAKDREIEVAQDEPELDFEPPEDWPYDDDWPERRIDAALAEQEEESERLIAEEEEAQRLEDEREAADNTPEALARQAREDARFNSEPERLIDRDLDRQEAEAESAAPELSEAQVATQEVLNEYAERAAQGEVMEDRTVQVNLGETEIADDLDQVNDVQDDQPVAVVDAEEEVEVQTLSPAQQATQEVLNDYQDRAEKGEVMADRTVAISLGHTESGFEQFELPPTATSPSNRSYEKDLENAKPDHIKERQMGNNKETKSYEEELTALRKRMDERKEREKSQGNERG